MNTKFNPFDMATHGLLSGNSFTIAVQGHLTLIEIEPVPPTILDRIGGGFAPSYFEKKKEEKKKWKIKVTVFKDGKEYKETKIVKSPKPPTISDINVEITEKNKIKINIINIK
jgi:hypothetical protein